MQERSSTLIDQRILSLYGMKDDKRGFDLLAETYFPLIRRLSIACLRRRGGGRRQYLDDNDLAHEALLRVHLKLRACTGLESIRSLGAWIRMVATHRAADVLRQVRIVRNREQLAEESSSRVTDFEARSLDGALIADERTATPDEALSHARLESHLESSLASLPTTNREALRLWIEEHSLKEIAQRLGLTINGAAAAKNRAAAAVARSLAVHDVRPRAFSRMGGNYEEMGFTERAAA